ncbi:MAG: hypothetical protein KKG76_03460 [Euryarchaeota archaeon]|nr:hypothetical protein [Euryarchaeota archaeon]
MRIDAKGMHYRPLNKMIRDAVASGEKEFELDNIGGQRYIGTGLNENVKITINGTPGNDLGAFMNGPRIIVNANAQDGIANTMNAGEIIVHGSVIYIRGKVDPYHLGKEVSCLELNEEDTKLIGSYLKEYCECFGFDYNEVMGGKFTKLVPLSHRPYGDLYVY